MTKRRYKYGDIFIDNEGWLSRVYFSLFGLILYKRIGKWAELEEGYHGTE